MIFLVGSVSFIETEKFIIENGKIHLKPGKIKSRRSKYQRKPKNIDFSTNLTLQ